MRCVEVIRELSAPSAGAQPPAVVEHLARCPRCAAWAARDARLGRVWDATHPPEPTAEVWESVWGRIGDALDRTPANILPMRRPAASRRAWYVALGVAAQVAAVLVAVLYFGHARTNPAPQATPVVQAAPPQPAPGSEPEEIELAPGEHNVIQIDGEHVKVTTLAMKEGPPQVDSWFEVHDSLEAIAQ